MTENKECPKCSSKNIKQDGSFAKKIKDGESASKEIGTIFFHCFDCENDWSKEDNF